MFDKVNFHLTCSVGPHGLQNEATPNHSLQVGLRKVVETLDLWQMAIDQAAQEFRKHLEQVAVTYYVLHSYLKGLRSQWTPHTGEV